MRKDYLLLPQRIDAALSVDTICENEQDNLSKAERNDLAKFVDILIEKWIER